jgi:hypothetical protein
MVLVCISPPVPTSQRGSLLTLDSVVISVFAIIILSTLGFLFKANHHELVGGDEDPEDGAAVAGTVFTAVFIYMVGPSRAALALRLAGSYTDVSISLRGSLCSAVSKACCTSGRAVVERSRYDSSTYSAGRLEEDISAFGNRPGGRCIIFRPCDGGLYQYCPWRCNGI